MPRKNITVTEEQEKFLDEVDINLSFIVQQKLDDLIEEWGWQQE